VVYICGCIPARIQHALADLPETLDETYQRTLREINKAHWEFAYRLFQFVAVASRPLRVKELAELLAFDFKAGPIPKFHEGWRLEDPEDAVLSTCSSLLAIVDGGYRFGKVIQFSHFSVKEFLTSTRLAETSHTILQRYHVSMTPAHTLVAQACLGILLHLDKDVVTSNSLKRWPLVEYAAEHWVYHARFEDVSRLGNVEEGMKQLFDPNKPHLSVCVWIHDPAQEQNLPSERPLPPPATPLHYAALWGFHFIVEFLVVGHSQDVHSQGFTDKVTPLDLASKHGHVKAAQMLIKHGADVMAQNSHGETPLHLASREGQVEVARMLIEHGADMATQNKNRETPFYLALIHGQVGVAGMLIERGADVTAQIMDGETPLHLATIWRQEEVVRMLIEHGADVTAQNKDGETPLRLALIEGIKGIAHVLTRDGAGVAAQNKDGETPLHLASFLGKVGAARMLIERGADLTIQNKDGDTPLHLALFWGQLEVARMLIDQGADVAAQNKDGVTPLNIGVARMPTERGVDVAAQNEDEEPPLHLARSHRNIWLLSPMGTLLSFLHYLYITLWSQWLPHRSWAGSLLHYNPHSPTPKRRALLIGISYHDSNSPIWVPLVPPHGDVESFQELLIRVYFIHWSVAFPLATNSHPRYLRILTRRYCRS
jgi:ankyrin repeat protein